MKPPDMVKFTMTKEGYEVVTALNGREAIELFEAENLILLFWTWCFQKLMVWKLLNNSQDK